MNRDASILKLQIDKDYNYYYNILSLSFDAYDNLLLDANL